MTKNQLSGLVNKDGLHVQLLFKFPSLHVYTATSIHQDRSRIAPALPLSGRREGDKCTSIASIIMHYLTTHLRWCISPQQSLPVPLRLSVAPRVNRMAEGSRAFQGLEETCVTRASMAGSTSTPPPAAQVSWLHVIHVHEHSLH